MIFWFQLGNKANKANKLRFHGACITSWWKKELWNKAKAGAAATVTCPMCRCAEPRALVQRDQDDGENESTVVARVDPV
jgi:hypothetical protein